VTGLTAEGAWLRTSPPKRYYTHAGTTVAVRDSATAALTYLLGDQLGFSTVSINAAGGTPVIQRFIPYGAHEVSPR
jgi:hypothetical protein